MNTPRTVVCVLLALGLTPVLAGACDDTDEAPAASTEPEAEVEPEPEPEPEAEPEPTTDDDAATALMPSVVLERHIDLPEPGLALGMPVRQARPPLTAGCVRDHYAERLGDRFLRLSCLVAETPFERRLRLAFLESDTEPTRLAYRIVETTLPEAHAGELWAHVNDEARNVFGSPDLVDTDSHVAWTGTGRDGQATMLELKLQRDGAPDGHLVVQQAWRHRVLVARLGLPR